MVVSNLEQTIVRESGIIRPRTGERIARKTDVYLLEAVDRLVNCLEREGVGALSEFDSFAVLVSSVGRPRNLAPRERRVGA